MQIDVEIKDKEVKRLFTRLKKNATDLKPAFREIGEIVRSSVIRISGGRPSDKWKATKDRSVYSALRGRGKKKRKVSHEGSLTKGYAG